MYKGKFNFNIYSYTFIMMDTTEIQIYIFNTASLLCSMLSHETQQKTGKSYI